MNRFHTKNIVITAIIVVLLIGIGAILYMQFSKNKGTPTQEISSTRPLDQTPDLGACQATTTQTIRSTEYGDKITAISEGTRVGVDGLTGEAADGCAYPFSTMASSNNLLTVTVYKYSTNKEQADKEQGGANWIEMSGSTLPMYYLEKSIDNGATSLAMLRTVTGGDIILITLRQPANAMGVKSQEAQRLLLGIATKINLSSVERKAEEQAKNSSNGDTPPPPPTSTVNETLTPSTKTD